MRLPEKKRPGDPVLATDWNLLVDAIAARTPRPTPGMELLHGSGGFIYRARPKSAAGGGGGKPVPLAILSSRPPYIPPPPEPPVGEAKRYYLEWGTVNDLVATNWNAHFDIATTTYIFAKVTFASGDWLKLAGWEILTGDSATEHETPDWPVGDDRPEYMVLVLGQVLVQEGKHMILSNGGGSIRVSEHVTSIYPGSAAGETLIGKELSYYRLEY